MRPVLDRLVPGTCVLADALHTQRETARQSLAAGLDFVLVAKENQPTVLEQIRDGFRWDCLRSHKTEDGDHGRIETRWIRVADELDPAVPYVDFPGLRFVAQVRREAIYKKDGREREPETAYLLTGLGPEQATPERLLALNRGYWAIENRVHYMRDVALDEDRSRCRKDALPRGLAAFANLSISILRLAGVKNIQDTMDLLHGDCLGTMMQLVCGSG